jgi:hypothetical protein
VEATGATQHTQPDANTAMPIGARIAQFDDVIRS